MISHLMNLCLSHQVASDISSDIQTNNITTRISILVLSFPTLRILWSRLSHFHRVIEIYGFISNCD